MAKGYVYLKLRSHSAGLRPRFIRVVRSGMNRDEPGFIHGGSLEKLGEQGSCPGCLKMYNTTGAQRESAGKMSRTGVNRGYAVVISAHSESVSSPDLYHDVPCMIKTLVCPDVGPVDPGCRMMELQFAPVAIWTGMV